MLILVDKTRQFQAKNRTLLSWILFLLLLVSIIIPFWSINHLEWSTLKIYSPGFIFVFLCLIPLNWGLEYLKYSLLLKSISLYSKDGVPQRSFLAGLVTGFVSPAYVGNFVGRLAYFKNDAAGEVTRMTMMSNWSQLLSTLLAGCLGLFLLQQELISINLSMGLYIVVAFGLLALYFALGFLRKSWRISFRLKVYWLIISLIRYTVFSFQFALMMLVFTDLDLSFIWAGVMVVYLLMTLSPSVLTGKLLVREAWTVFVFSLLGVGANVALCAAFLVWLGNNALPALYAWVVVKKSAKPSLNV